MTSPDTNVRRWLNRPARPTAGVLFAAAALLAALAAIALIDVFTAPLPPVQYGPFGGPHALTCAVVLAALFITLGVRAARGLSPTVLIFTLVVLLAAGPVGWGASFLDSQGPDVINSVGSTGAFVAIVLLVVAPLLSIVGVVAGLAELIRSAVDSPREQSRQRASLTDEQRRVHPRLHRPEAHQGKVPQEGDAMPQTRDLSRDPSFADQSAGGPSH